MRTGKRFVRRTSALAAACALPLWGCGVPEPTFDASRAWRHLVAQVDAGPRVPGTEAHRATLLSIREHLAPLADRVSVHEFVAMSPIDAGFMPSISLNG